MNIMLDYMEHIRWDKPGPTPWRVEFPWSVDHDSNYCGPDSWHLPGWALIEYYDTPSSAIATNGVGYWLVAYGDQYELPTKSVLLQYSFADGLVYHTARWRHENGMET